MMVSYRTNDGTGSHKFMLAKTDDLQIAFNRVAQRLKIADAITSKLRVEGRIKIGKKNYPAIMQGDLLVVKDGPTIPERVEIKF